jgi:hypothetical protein
MGAKSPSPSLFCSGPLFRVYALLWSFVGRRTGRWIEPGYERLPECVGYSLWRHHHEASGPMPLRARLQWSWADFKKTCRLFIRCLEPLGRSISRSRLQARLGSAGEAIGAGADPPRARLVPPESSG